MQRERRHLNLATLVLLCVFFGGASGIVADLVYNNYFNQPYSLISGEINVSNGAFNRSKFEINGPKNVVVEQNDKVDETINSTKSSLVGLFKKNVVSKSQSKADGLIFDFYRIGQEAGQGLVITSDGWIVTNLKLDDMNNYVAVTSDKKVYEINKFLADKLTPFYFIHVDAKDFPVKKFASPGDVSNGQLVIAANWSGHSVLTPVNNIDEEAPGLVKSSDAFSSKISTLQNVNGGLTLVDLAGDVVGLIDKSGNIEPINHLEAAFTSLLATQSIKRPALGVNYVDISELIVAKQPNVLPMDIGALIFKDDKGVAVVAGSAASGAGLKDGDIISSVENINIDSGSNLTEALQNFQPGASVNISYIRNGEKKEVEVKLGELK